MGHCVRPDANLCDLVVVGGGFSGPSAAHSDRRDHPDARILVLENHDDFGGHTKRNESRVGVRTLIAHGGSEILEEPGDFSEVAKGLFDDLDIHPQRLGDAYDFDF